MTSRWWRAYDDALHDPKVQRLPPHLFKTWFNLLCVASKHGGELPPVEDIAFLLRRKVEDVGHDLAKLIARGLFDKAEGGGATGGATAIWPHNWAGRQYRSDVSTQRVRKHRKRFNGVSETAPDTDTERSIPLLRAREVVDKWKRGLR